MSDDVFLDEKIALDKELETDTTLEQSELEPIPLNKMDVALESITALTDISRTISVEGVSTHDIQAVETIRGNLTNCGFILDSKLSLEGYSKLVTPYRSSLNLTVSNESILKTISETIKRWIKLLYDAVIRSLQWLKSLAKHDIIVNAKIKTFDEVAIKMHGVFMYVSRVNPRVGNELFPYILKIAEDTLVKGGLPRSPATVVGLNEFAFKGIVYPRDFKRLHGEILNSVSDLDQRVITLGDILESYKSKTVDSKLAVHLYTMDSDLPRQVEELEAYFVESDDVDWLKDNITPTYFENTAHRLNRREMYGYKNIYDSYAAASNGLSKLKDVKLEGPDVDLETISEHIKSINVYIKNLNTIVELLTKLKSVYVKSSATLINFYIQAFDLIRTDMGNVKMTDVMTGNWTKAERDMDALKKKVGLA